MKLALAVLAVLAPAAHADSKKPLKPDAAKAAAVNFAKSVINIDDTHPKAAELATAAKYAITPFRLYTLNNDKAECDATAADKEKLDDALVCLKKNPASLLPLKPYTAAVLKELWADLRDRKAEIEKLAKTHTLLVHESANDGVHELAIVAVTADADGTAKVAAVFSGYLTK
jgi:hypothetical protein